MSSGCSKSARGDVFKLAPVGKGVLDDDEEFFQLTGICTTGESTTKVRCCCRDDLGKSGLNHFGVVRNRWKLVQEKECGALGRRQAGQRAQGGERFASAGFLGCIRTGYPQALGDVQTATFHFFARA